MFLRRALLRLFKLAVYTLLTWVSVAVTYLTLPSPVPSDASVIASLQSGGTVTRVFDRQKGFTVHTDNTRQSFIVEFKLIHDASGSLTLRFGGGYDPLDNVNAILEPRSTPNIPIHYHNISLDFSSAETIQSAPPVTLRIPSGDVDGLIPPYVATADASLLFWWMNHDTSEIGFRVRKIAEEGLIELWPDSNYWYGNHNKMNSPSGFPLISVKLDEPGNLPSFSFPPFPYSSSPSITYRLRLGCLLFLLPVAGIGMVLLSACFGIFHGILELVYLALNIVALGVVCAVLYGIYWWIRNERPRMSVSLTDVREVLDNTLDNVRMRSEAREREGRDLEAQNPERTDVGSIGTPDQAASLPDNSTKLEG